MLANGCFFDNLWQLRGTETPLRLLKGCLPVRSVLVVVKFSSIITGRLQSYLPLFSRCSLFSARSESEGGGQPASEGLCHRWDDPFVVTLEGVS
jgi:hypothetical protein